MIHYTLTDLLNLFECVGHEGTYKGVIKNIESLSQAKEEDLSFLATPQYVPNAKYKAQVAASHASIILLPQEYQGSRPKSNQVYLRVAHPSLALARLCKEIEKSLFPRPVPGIHPTAVVDPTALIDPTAYVGPLCIIEKEVKIEANVILNGHVYVGAFSKIGRDTHIFPHVAIYGHCELGQRVRLHAGSVIGSDGYGYELLNGLHEKIPQIGTVILEDDVEIGANTTVDRARFGQTIIQKGTKIDNLVQIAHNVKVGKNCLLVSQVGISGSTTIEDYVVLGGQVGVAGHLTIGHGTQVGAQSGIHTDLPVKSKVLGSPAHPFMQALKIEALKKELPDLFKRVRTLEKKVLNNV